MEAFDNDWVWKVGGRGMLQGNATAMVRAWERTATAHKSTSIKILLLWYN